MEFGECANQVRTHTYHIIGERDVRVRSFTLGFFAVGSNPEKKAFILKGPDPGVQRARSGPLFSLFIRVAVR